MDETETRMSAWRISVGVRIVCIAAVAALFTALAPRAALAAPSAS